MRGDFTTRHLAGIGTIVLFVAAFFAFDASAQTAPSSVPAGPQDPGVRGGPAGAGGPLPGLATLELNFFNAALARFRAVESVSGTINDAPSGTINGSGLGPRFNLNSCAGCHSQPAIGGTSSATNPEIAVATLDGATNTIPPFISLHGPVREARFIANPNGTADGTVHDLFVITGRSDASGCNIAQPNFAQAISQGNIIFRIPTPLFGAGQVENTPDLNLENDASAVSSQRKTNGVSGAFNRSANDGTVTRFGWKAQNKSMLVFSGEAYNVELGVTNELFPNERDDTLGCQFNGLPEDATNLVETGLTNSPASDLSSDIVNFAAFMRLSAGPKPVVPAAASAAASAARGLQTFENVGCNLCHIRKHTTAKSMLTGQSNITFAPFSDFELHDMGTGLQDQISQGQADGDQFRTAPLWGVGQRIFFLHDGRTQNLLQAIEAHSSNGSEANTVIGNFNALPVSSQQDILNFLRAL
jgi:CxxC motif-containing protein (DUF1111 family)